MVENKCPHDGATLVQTHLMYIEACPKCEYCFDVAHGREVEYEWVYGDYDEDEFEDDDLHDRYGEDW